MQELVGEEKAATVQVQHLQVMFAFPSYANYEQLSASTGFWESKMRDHREQAFVCCCCFALHNFIFFLRYIWQALLPFKSALVGSFVVSSSGSSPDQKKIR